MTQMPAAPRKTAIPVSMIDMIASIHGDAISAWTLGLWRHCECEARHTSSVLFIGHKDARP
jgi:hypothetical protein